MTGSESSKSRRINVMVSEPLVEWASEAAEERGMSLSALVRQALERERERLLEQEISEAAEELAELYESDDELTAFAALDSEDFA